MTGSLVASNAPVEITVQLGPLPSEGITDVQAYPNPFDSRTRDVNIHYVLAAAADVSIKIYSIYGREVANIHFGAGSNGGIQGSNVVSWDGSSEAGGKVSKGMYIAVVESGGAREVLKIGVIH